MMIMAQYISKPQFEFFDKSLLIRAPAKINLSLLVGKKRPDGFHEIETVMAKIDFYDELTFEQTDSEGIELSCKGPKWAPSGSDNLIYTACRLFYEAIQQRPKIKITLQKNIPAASGLGGASSDAASTLLALNRVFKNPLSEEKLVSISAALGSDVPFFITGPLAFCTGRGEKIEIINKIFPFRALLIIPDISISTKRVYENFKEDLAAFESLKTQIKAYLDENRLDLAQKMCANMLSKASFDTNEQLRNIKAYVESICPVPVCLSGSGSSLFAVFADTDYQNIEITQRRIREDGRCDCVMVCYNQW